MSAESIKVNVLECGNESKQDDRTILVSGKRGSSRTRVHSGQFHFVPVEKFELFHYFPPAASPVICFSKYLFNKMS